MMIKIGIQGNKGSFSEEAARIFVDRKKLTNVQFEYLISSINVLTAIDKNKIDYGILAIENARGGVVIESVEGLAGYCCQIIDMFHFKVNQNLLTLSGVTAKQISAIHSHQQALRQCRDYLADNFWSCPLIEEDDTAEAARRLKLGELVPTTAVIASKDCAKLYGLEIFQENIHDLKNNLTLFLGVSKKK